MSYKVTRAIYDTQDKNRFYDTGDNYPRAGLNPTDERVNELLDLGVIMEDQDLTKLKRDELVAMAEDKGLKVDDKDTKADIIEQLEG